MKFIKKLLTLILILLIILLLRHIYSTFKEDNVSIGDFNLPFYPGTSDSIINVTSPSTTSAADISGISDSISSTSKKLNKYYYNQLDSNAKIIYDNLETNIPNLKKDNLKINFSTQFNSLLNQTNGTKELSKSFQSAVDAFFYDHPELFYIDLTQMSLYTKSTSFAGKTTYNVSIIPSRNNYLDAQFPTEASAEKAEKSVEAIRNSFTNQVSGDTYQKILQVHDTLVNILQYDSTLSRPNTHNIYGALIERKVVCEGYAKSLKYILDSLNIPCILVGGTATNSKGKTESHMWNYVQINGKWYGIDPTWDDPIIVGGYSKNTIRHDYLCKGSLVFNKSHVVSNTISEKGIKFKVPTLSVENYR